MGGTFMSLPTDYRDYFVRNLHDALSGHTSKDVAEAVRQAPTRRAPRPGGGLPGAAYTQSRCLACRLSAVAAVLTVPASHTVRGVLPGSENAQPSLPIPPFGPLQVQRAVPHQVYQHDDRNAARLLPHTPPLPDALLRLHPPGDWAAGEATAEGSQNVAARGSAAVVAPPRPAWQPALCLHACQPCRPCHACLGPGLTNPSSRPSGAVHL